MIIKRALAATLCLIIVLVLLPKTARGYASHPSAVYIAGCNEPLTSSTQYYHNNAEPMIDDDPEYANAEYNPDTGVLTLTNFMATNYATHGNKDCCIYIPGSSFDELTIILNDSNLASVPYMQQTRDNPAYSLYADCNVTIDGNGSLCASCGAEATSSTGIYVSGTLTIVSGSISGHGGVGVFERDLKSSMNTGVQATRIKVSGGTLEGIAYDTTNAEGSTSYGIVADIIEVSDGGIIIGMAGQPYYGSTGKAKSSAGVYGRIKISASGGSITGTGGEATGASGSSCGVYGCGQITASGGSITGMGGKAATGGFGMYAVGDISATGGSITGAGNVASSTSSGVYTAGTIKANDGSITGIGDTVTGVNGYSSGVYAGSGIIASGGSITGTGGRATESNCRSYGLNAYNLAFLSGRLTGESTSGSIVAAISAEPDLPQSAYYWRIGKSNAYTQSLLQDYSWDATHTYVDIRTSLPSKPSITVSVPAYGAGQAPQNETVTIRADEAIDATNNFGSAAMDGAPINLGTVGTPGSEGSVENGSIVIRLNKAYLDTLPAEKHTLRVNLAGVYAGQHVEIQITVTAPATVPKTGDAAMPVLWLMIAFMTCAGLAVSEVSRRKRQNDS